MTIEEAVSLHNMAMELATRKLVATEQLNAQLIARIRELEGGNGAAAPTEADLPTAAPIRKVPDNARI